MSLEERMGRLLVIVPFVAARDGVALSELAAKLGATSKQILADIDLLAMVGRPPLTPDHLIDLYVEDGVVYVDLHQNLSRPLQLTQDEASALLLGAKLVGRSGGLGDDLEVVLDKLAARMHPAHREMLKALGDRIHVGQDDVVPAAPSATLRRACSMHIEVLVHYYSASQDRHKRYRLQPLGVFLHGGFEYLAALDTEADGQEKLFRVDRMGEVQQTGEVFVPPQAFDLEKYRTRQLYFGRGDLEASVWLSPRRAQHARELFGSEDIVERSDGSVVVRVVTSSPAWLARWALAYGEDAEILSPAAARRYIAGICAVAARQYRGDPLQEPGSGMSSLAK